MKVEDITEYQNVRIDIVRLEQELEKKIAKLGMSEEMVQDRCHDFLQRGMVVDLNFDTINYAFFDDANIADIKNLLFQHKALRKKQRQCERKVEIERVKTFAREEKIT